MFDEYFNPPTIVVSPIPVAVKPRAVDIAESHVSMSINLDAPSTNSTSHGSSSNMRPSHTPFKHLGRWTKDHPIANMIGDPSRSVSTRKQLETDAMWCYFDAFLTSVEPKNFKHAMTKPSWIDEMQKEIHEFKRLQVWELVPCPNKVMLIKLKCIYKVKTDEFGGVLKNKARLNREPISEDILGATIQRDTRSYYPKRYWELLSKEILGAITQRDTRSYNPKRYYELLPKEILGAITQRCRTGMSYGKMEGLLLIFYCCYGKVRTPFECVKKVLRDDLKRVLVVVIVEVVIVVVIIGVVVIVGGVSSILKFSFDKASSDRVPVANVTLSSSTHLLRENTDSVHSNQRMRPTTPFVAAWLQCCNNTISNQLQNGSLSSSGTGSLPSGRVDLIGNEDPTDEDGDTGMGDSKGVSVSLRWLKIS
ncbi:hypothetical protein Tco_0655963 [Tanacetum coccineum]|uniref:Integrase, catalytic region, zinc finger, CCHC-type, peptidase aspartic, catalytic n=1 Tax=Tanacetum coccineum TaxID=301880 RepID=A0ABQ4X7H0_9ASTR